MANKRKITTAIVAGVTAVALMLGGTFAWTSISQQAKNEAIVDINPGGRLHDDFNGTNKDVYVENFGDTTTGVPIYARVRLDQYFEVGQEAGKNKTNAMADRNVKPLIGEDINNVKTWVPYIPGENDLADTAKVPANGNWQWKLGNDESNKPYYMPTFNMNKDSLAADINGTYEGTTDGDIVHYDDYKTYTADQPATGTEVYDWDDNDADEEENPTITTVETTPRDSADVYHKENQTHTAKPISSTATVITMAQWIADGKPVGPYWVYDTDGWAYWAQAIEPGETTGLLLDGITMSRVPDDNWYYGINVVGEFATKGDIYQFEDMSPEAEELFATITGLEAIVIEGSDAVAIGGSEQYTASRTILGQNATNQPASFTWDATATDAAGQPIEGIEISADGILTVAETVPYGTEITITATASDVATADTETEALEGRKVVIAAGTLTISPANTDSFADGGYMAWSVNNTLQLAAAMTVGDETTSIEAGQVNWSVTKAVDTAGTTVSEDGILTLGSEGYDPHIVTVTCEYNGMTDEYHVLVAYNERLFINVPTVDSVGICTPGHFYQTTPLFRNDGVNFYPKDLFPTEASWEYTVYSCNLAGENKTAVDASAAYVTEDGRFVAFQEGVYTIDAVCPEYGIVTNGYAILQVNGSAVQAEYAVRCRIGESTEKTYHTEVTVASDQMIVLYDTANNQEAGFDEYMLSTTTEGATVRRLNKNQYMLDIAEGFTGTTVTIDWVAPDGVTTGSTELTVVQQ